MATKIVLALVISLLAYAATGAEENLRPCRSSAEQCRLQRLRTLEPTRRIQSEGGLTEIWDPSEDELQCAGVAAIRNTLQPNSLFLPGFHPAPLLVYIEQGEGLMGLSHPGCAETYESESQRELSRRRSFSRSRAGGSQEQEQRERRSDHHQKVHRFRRGDILAIPAGAVHWCYNDGNEELVAFAVMDLNNQANQLDLNFRSFFLAGGEPRQEGQRGERGTSRQRGMENFQSLFSGFSEELLAEAYDIPINIARRLQEDESRRGIIVRCQDEMRRMIRPDEEREDQERRWTINGEEENGVEETICTTRFRHNMNTQCESDIVSRQAGRIHLVNQHKLPILRFMDLSAEKGRLFPNAIYTPHWSMTDHRIVYVLRGDAQVQIVDNHGNTVFNDRVNRGQMFVIPQFYAVTTRVGNEGFEYVSMKTSGQPMKSPMAGYTSVIRAMPIDVLVNSYRMSPREAQDLKYNRGHQSFLLSSGRSSASP